MTALTVRTHQASFDIAPSTWAILKEQAGMLVRSGFLPVSVKTPEQAVTIMLKGRELGIPAMQAFSHIHVINGKPTISAELMLALIYRECPGAKIEYVRYEADGCTIKATRPGHAPSTFSFTRADAEAAQLLVKDTWRKFPRAMYRSRCISEMARSVFPDCIMGCSYTPEEIDPDIRLGEDGAIDVTPSRPTPPAPSATSQESREESEATTDVPFEGPPADTPASSSERPRTGGGVLFTGTEPERRLAMAQLRAKRVPENHWETVLKKMVNRPSGEIHAVIAEVTAQ